MVFVSLSNGLLVVFLRDIDHSNDGSGACWLLTAPKVITVASNEPNCRSKLCIINERYLWYAYGRNIFIYEIDTLSLHMKLPVQIGNVGAQSQVLITSIDIMEPISDHSGIWISFKNSPLIQLYDAKSYRLLMQINLYEPVNRMLGFGNDIIRQHKVACLRATALLNVDNSRENCDTLFVGTSAGLILYLTTTKHQFNKLANQESITEWCPQIASLRHGHSGNVKFLHLTRNTIQEAATSEVEPTRDAYPSDENEEVFLVSGGTGADLYGPADMQGYSRLSSDEDNVNHLILWKL